MIAVREIVSLETPQKYEAAPITAKRPGSIQAPYSSVWTPNIDTMIRPTILPHKAPVYLMEKMVSLTAKLSLEFDKGYDKSVKHEIVLPVTLY